MGYDINVAMANRGRHDLIPVRERVGQLAVPTHAPVAHAPVARSQQPCNITQQDANYFTDVGQQNADEYTDVAEQALGMVKWVGGFLAAVIVGSQAMKRKG